VPLAQLWRRCLRACSQLLDVMTSGATVTTTLKVSILSGAPETVPVRAVLLPALALVVHCGPELSSPVPMVPVG